MSPTTVEECQRRLTGLIGAMGEDTLKEFNEYERVRKLRGRRSLTLEETQILVRLRPSYLQGKQVQTAEQALRKARRREAKHTAGAEEEAANIESISNSIAAAIREIDGGFIERGGVKAGTFSNNIGSRDKPVTWRDLGNKQAMEKTRAIKREAGAETLEQMGWQQQGVGNHEGVAPQSQAMPRFEFAQPILPLSMHHEGVAPQSQAMPWFDQAKPILPLSMPQVKQESRTIQATVAPFKSNKRPCIRSEQRQKEGNGSNVVTVGVGLGVLSKCWSFLSISDVHSVSLTCTKWRNAVWQSAPLWEGLIAQKYYSHQHLPEGWCVSGRDEYLRRMTLMKSRHAPVRDLDGLPLPLQRKTSGDDLMRQWNPEAVVFLVDVFSGRNHFDDDVTCYKHDPVEQKRRLGPQVPIYSTIIRVPSVGRADNVTTNDPFHGLTLREDRMCVCEELQMSPQYEEERAAIKAIEDFHDATIGSNIPNGLRDEGGLYVEMSYYVEGGNVPKCDPITLLSEHHTFLVNCDDGRMTYRTDVEPAWLPGRHDWDNSESVWDKEEALHRSKVLSRQISKYGGVPLPFDPQVELRLSPPGERSMGHLWDDGFENDNRSNCSIFAEIGFSIGEDDFNCNFAKMAVPPLLSLWNDAAILKSESYQCS